MFGSETIVGRGMPSTAPAAIECRGARHQHQQFRTRREIIGQGSAGARTRRGEGSHEGFAMSVCDDRGRIVSSDGRRRRRGAEREATITMRRHEQHVGRESDDLQRSAREAGSTGPERAAASDILTSDRTGAGWGESGLPGPALRAPLGIHRLPAGADPTGATTTSAPAPAVGMPETPVADPAAPTREAATSPAMTGPSTTSAPAAAGLIVEDGAEGLAGGQVTKSAFLAQLRAAVTASAEEAMAGSPWSTRNCPWIEHWFGYYQGKPAAHVEAAIRKYTGGGSVADALGYLPLVSGRVRSAVGIWVRTGRVTGVPEEMAGAVGGGEKIQAKAIGAGVQETMDPVSVRSRLGPGQPIGGDLGSRFGAALGHDLGDVRIHTDAGAAQMSARMGARAFAVGNHVAFGGGEFRPGTPMGDGLLAHELAHVVQQRGATDQGSGSAGESALERDAERATVGAVTRMYGGAAPSGGIGPALSGGLSLQRCSLQEQAPVEYLDTPKMKAMWIADAMRSKKTFASVEIMKVLRAATSTAEVIEIESQVDMPRLVELIDDDWSLVELGAMAPVPASVAKTVNEARANYIVDKLDDFGPARAEVITHYIINTIPTNDDVEAVLRILAARKKLAATIGSMKSVQALIASRGIDLKKFADRSWEGMDIARGLGHGIGSIFEGGEAAKGARGMEYMSRKMDLPKEYGAVLDEIDKKEMAEALDPTNLALGMADYVMLNIPSGIYGTVSSTVQGIKDLAGGKVEEGSAELVPALLLLVSLLGVRVMKGGSGAAATEGAAAELNGPAGAGQFTIKGFSGPIPKDVARLQSLMMLNEEAQITAGMLVQRLGAERVSLAAQYVRASREAMLFVEKEGLPALDELVKANGNVATAKAALAKMPKLLAATSSAGRTIVVRSSAEALEVAAREGWEFDAVTPGPLPDGAAGTFAGGKYNRGVTQPGQKFYKGGDANNPGGSFSNFEPPEGAAQVRIDNAVKPQWLDKEGVQTGTSPINALIEIEYPAGTEYYYGPVSSQGGVYVGGQGMIQIFVPNSRAIGTFKVIKRF